MARKSSNVIQMHPEQITLALAAVRFLAERDLAPGSRRLYALTFEKLAEDLGTTLPLHSVTTEMLRDHLDRRYGSTSPATYNRNRATVGSLFSWAVRQRLITGDPTEMVERKKDRRTDRQADQQRSIDYSELEALWTPKDLALREKTLWRMLYETAARADEVLSLNIEDLDLAERSARIVGKGGHVERVFWATGTTRLLPRLIGERTIGPLFLSERPPRVAMAKADLDPVSGHARLSYRRAAEIFTEASGGHTLHQLRHSALTHYAEAGVDVALLKAKSRHRSLRSLERYVRPSEASVAKLTAEHDRARRR